MGNFNYTIFFSFSRPTTLCLGKSAWSLAHSVIKENRLLYFVQKYTLILTANPPILLWLSILVFYWVNHSHFHYKSPNKTLRPSKDFLDAELWNFLEFDIYHFHRMPDKLWFKSQKKDYFTFLTISNRYCKVLGSIPRSS